MCSLLCPPDQFDLGGSVQSNPALSRGRAAPHCLFCLAAITKSGITICPLTSVLMGACAHTKLSKMVASAHREWAELPMCLVGLLCIIWATTLIWHGEGESVNETVAKVDHQFETAIMMNCWRGRKSAIGCKTTLEAFATKSVRSADPFGKSRAHAATAGEIRQRTGWQPYERNSQILDAGSAGLFHCLPKDPCHGSIKR